jgi:predicted alpha/beta hydrolase family esterase
MVHQDDWDNPDLSLWTERLADAVNAAERPVVLVAHSLGVATVLQSIPKFRARVAGAFLVAPVDLADAALAPSSLSGFGPYPRDPLPFPGLLVASRNDPFCRYEVADELAASLGALLVDGGESGHINIASGHGPWPEGTMVFAGFLGRLT